MKHHSLVAFAVLINICQGALAEEPSSTLLERAKETARILHVTDGYFKQDLFRRVADDDTSTGFAVMANPRYHRNRDAQPARLAGNFYIRDIPAGQYRVIFRLKAGEIPVQPAAVVSWDVNTNSAGVLASGIIETTAFKQPLVYQDFEITVFVPLGIEWIDPRLFWQGKIPIWIDTIQIINEKSSAPIYFRTANTGEIGRLADMAEPKAAETWTFNARNVTKEMYRETAGIFLENVRRTLNYWLKQPQPYPSMSEYVEYIKWLAYMYRLTGDRSYSRIAVDGIAQAHRLLLLPQKQGQDIRPKWQEVAPLYFIDKWLNDSPDYGFAHRAWVRTIAIRAAPVFPENLVEHGAFNRSFLGAITGEALLSLVPDAPDAAKWRKYKDSIWDYWWRFRDTDESSEHYNALWFRYLLQWVEMRGIEEQFWSDPKVKNLFERYLYQVFPMGSLPHYSDSPGWNAAWGHWVYLFEACATHYKDGRFKWAAHRIYNYSVNRIEAITSWPYTGREAGWSLLNAYAISDDSIPLKSREIEVALLKRHKIVQRNEAERKTTNQYFDLMFDMAPDKMVFYGGNHRNALSMMVDVVGAASHSHARPPALISLADRQSVLLMSLGYTDILPEHHNIPTLADYEGFPYDNTPYHIKNENNVVKGASTVDLGAIGYGRIFVSNFEGYPASLTRDIVFIKNAGVMVKDTLTTDVSFHARWSPGFRTRNAVPGTEANWTDTYLGEWIPVRGLNKNAPIVARWRNSPRNLLIYFLPSPAGKLEIVDDRATDLTIPLPLRVQYTMRQRMSPHTPISSAALLLPHGQDSAASLARDVRVVHDMADQTIVEFRDDEGISNLVVLNPTGRLLQADNLSTDAVVACIRHKAKAVISVSMLKGKTLKFDGAELAQAAPLPVSHIVPEP